MSVPDSAVVLAVQAAQARYDLYRIEKLLADAVVADAANQAIRDRFHLLVRGATDDLDRLTELAARRGASPGLWSRMATSRTQVTRISREALAFLQGILLRASGLDDGVGVVADRMLAGLTSRTGVDRSVVTTADDREFLDHTVSMVRLRFPDTSVWGLPILAHELGHHVASSLTDANPQLRGTQPVLRYLSSAAEEESRAGSDPQQARAWLHELFADVYATYALGAAYPLAVMVLRARPDQYSDATKTHPSWRRRVLTMLGALDAMGALSADPAGAMAYRLMAQKRVLPVWRMMSGDDVSADEAGRRAMGQAADMVELFRHAPDRLRYNTSAPIERLVTMLDQVATDPVWRPGQLAELPAGTDIAHVLNAAWRWRVEHWNGSTDETNRVSLAALQCCRVAEA